VNRGRPLRILVVNWLDRKNPRAGGAEVHLHSVFGRLADRGHRITALTSGWKGSIQEESLDGMRIVRAGRRYTFGLAAPVSYRRFLRDQPHDVVVEDLNKVPLFTPAWTAAGRHAFIVHHLFGSTAFKAANPVLAAATWLMERGVPGLLRGRPCVTVSRSTHDDLVARGVDPASLLVIPNGVSVGPPAQGKRFPEPTALYLGRLERYKCLDLAIRALARVREGGVGMELIIAGRGEDRARLEGLSRQLGLQSHLTFRGYVPEEEKVSLLERSWFHVYPSPKEGWGLANLEAAERSTPAVASNSPGLRDSVVTEPGKETGFLVPHGDVDALAGAMMRLADPDTRDRLGRNARAFAESLSWDHIADQFEAWLTAMASGGEEVKAPVGPTGPLTST